MMPGEPRVRTSTTHTLEVIGGDVTVCDLQAFLAEKQPAAKVSISKQAPDRPGELTVVRLEVTEE